MLCSCTVGPDFKRPEPPGDKIYLTDGPGDQTVAVRDVLGGEAQHFVQNLDIPAQWWQVYQSRPLDDLIKRAIAANPDVRTAMLAVRVAQENAKAQRAALFPLVTASGSATQNQTSNAIAPTPSNNNTSFGLFTGALNITYLLDLWGGMRRAAESLEATAESQCFLLEAAYLTLASNVVVAAITEASLRGQIANTERTIQIQRETLTLLQRRLAIGQAAMADVATQQAALAQSEATLPPLRNLLSQQRNLLAQLTGQTTAHLPAETFDLDSLTLPQELPVSLPSRMVEQRPDVRSAESSIHAAAAGVGVATANMLPQITLGASIGSTATDLALLFSPALGMTTAAGITNATQTLLDGGALSAKRRAAVATWEQARSQYQSTVLTAFRNVADTLRSLENDAVTFKAAVDSERAARLSLEITRRRLAAGDAGILEVLTAETTYRTALNTLVLARAARYADTAALFQALGGGWWNRDAAGNPDPAKRTVCKPPSAMPRISNTAVPVAPATSAPVTSSPAASPPTTSTAPPPTPESGATPPASKPSRSFWGGRL